VAYFSLKVEDKVVYGVGVDDNISFASIKALVSGLNVGRG
jgi:hypothetical protein